MSKARTEAMVAACKAGDELEARLIEWRSTMGHHIEDNDHAERVMVMMEFASRRCLAMLKGALGRQVEEAGRLLKIAADKACEDVIEESRRIEADVRMH